MGTKELLSCRHVNRDTYSAMRNGAVIVTDLPDTDTSVFDREELELIKAQNDEVGPQAGQCSNDPEGCESEEKTRDINYMMASRFYLDTISEPVIEKLPEEVSVETPKVDTSQIRVGMTVKNYKEMCRLLHEDHKDGNSKKAQIKEWRRFLEWDRAGQRYLITDLYAHPLPKDDGRHDGNRAKYIRYIERILMHYLARREDYTMSLSRRQWWKLLGMVNERYMKASSLELRVMNNLFSDYEIRQFRQRCFRKLNEILRNALRSMKDRALITWKKQTVVIQPETKGGSFIANDIEEDAIEKAKKTVLDEMKVKKESWVYFLSRQNEFYQKLGRILNEKYGWEYIFNRFCISADKECTIDEIPEAEVEAQKRALNSIVFEALNMDAEKEYQKNGERYLDGMTQFRLPDWYIEVQRELAKILILPENGTEKTVGEYLEEEHPELDSMFAG